MGLKAGFGEEITAEVYADELSYILRPTDSSQTVSNKNVS